MRGKLGAIAFTPDGESLAIAGHGQFNEGTLGDIYEVRILQVKTGDMAVESLLVTHGPRGRGDVPGLLTRR